MFDLNYSSDESDAVPDLPAGDHGGDEAEASGNHAGGDSEEEVMCDVEGDEVEEAAVADTASDHLVGSQQVGFASGVSVTHAPRWMGIEELDEHQRLETVHAGGVANPSDPESSARTRWTRWTRDEEEALRALVAEFAAKAAVEGCERGREGTLSKRSKHWPAVAERLGSKRSGEAVMEHWRKVMNSPTSKGGTTTGQRSTQVMVGLSAGGHFAVRLGVRPFGAPASDGSSCLACHGKHRPHTCSKGKGLYSPPIPPPEGSVAPRRFAPPPAAQTPTLAQASLKRAPVRAEVEDETRRLKAPRLAAQPPSPHLLSTAAAPAALSITPPVSPPVVAAAAAGGWGWVSPLPVAGSSGGMGTAQAATQAAAAAAAAAMQVAAAVTQAMTQAEPQGAMQGAAIKEAAHDPTPASSHPPAEASATTTATAAAPPSAASTSVSAPSLVSLVDGLRRDFGFLCPLLPPMPSSCGLLPVVQAFEAAVCTGDDPDTAANRVRVPLRARALMLVDILKGAFAEAVD